MKPTLRPVTEKTVAKLDTGWLETQVGSVQPREFPGVELLRFICALAVIIWHYPNFFSIGILTEKYVQYRRNEFPLYWVFAPFYEHGLIAVQVFWMISGFIFFWKYSQIIHLKNLGFLEFMMLRLSRLYPLHLATLLLVCVLMFFYQKTHVEPFIYGNNDLFHFFLQIVFVSNWLNRMPFAFNGPIWSISVEILAYIAFFLIVRQLRPNLALCIIVVIFSKLVARFHEEYIVWCIHFFFAGGIVQFLSHYLNFYNKFFLRFGFILCIIGGVIVNYKVLEPSASNILWISANMLFFCCCLRIHSPVIRLVFGELGNLTYSSYLLHYPMQLMIVTSLDFMDVSREVFLSPLVCILYLLATFGAAWIVHRKFEKPIQILIRNMWVSHQRFRSSA
jgi:peptidoglycan/LPS O-acetylase OafA/YrhL